MSVSLIVDNISTLYTKNEQCRLNSIAFDIYQLMKGHGTHVITCSQIYKNSIKQNKKDPQIVKRNKLNAQSNYSIIVSKRKHGKVFYDTLRRCTNVSIIRISLSNRYMEFEDVLYYFDEYRIKNNCLKLNDNSLSLIMESIGFSSKKDSDTDDVDSDPKNIINKINKAAKPVKKYNPRAKRRIILQKSLK